MIGQVYGRPPFQYSTDFMVNLIFRTDPEVVAGLLPPPLRRADPQLASISVVHHKLSPMGPYFGAYLGVVATHQGETVGFSISGVKDIFYGVVAGREIWGMPLQMGSVVANWHGELFKICIGRTPDIPFCEIILQLQDRITFDSPKAKLVFAPPPHGYGDSARRVLVGVEMETNLDNGECWSTKANARMLGGTPLDDWSQLPILDVVGCSYMAGATVFLPSGHVVDSWEACD